MFAENTQNNLNQKVCLECNRQFTGIVAACPHDGTLLVSIVQDPMIGTTLGGKYEIQEVIGHGGMGVVYKARHALMERIVAIKMLQAQLISDSMSVKRFQQESKAASRISHPNVITIYDFGISPNGQPFIVMDYLQGISLASVIKTEGQVGVERSIKILTQACDALEHAHKQGVIHRDLKQTNIVLINYDEEKDFVKVVDFGVAKLMESNQEGQRLTQQGEVCGSPVYMSPEQCTGLELDPRSDIYSMGIVVYETLTGKLPILGKTMVDTMSKHISEMPPSFSQARPDLYIPERLEQVVFKALSKDPNDRHQSMDELKMDLETAIPRPGKSQVLRTAPTKDQTPSEIISAFIKETPIAAWTVISLIVISLGAGLVTWRISANNSREQSSTSRSGSPDAVNSAPDAPANQVESPAAEVPTETTPAVPRTTGTVLTTSTPSTAAVSSKLGAASAAGAGTTRPAQAAPHAVATHHSPPAPPHKHSRPEKESVVEEQTAANENSIEVPTTHRAYSTTGSLTTEEVVENTPVDNKPKSARKSHKHPPSAPKSAAVRKPVEDQWNSLAKERSYLER